MASKFFVLSQAQLRDLNFYRKLSLISSSNVTEAEANRCAHRTLESPKLLHSHLLLNSSVTEPSSPAQVKAVGQIVSKLPPSYTSLGGIP